MFAAVALLAWPVSRHLLDWQPGLALVEPWRAWTAVAVHYSAFHLGANLLGTLLVAALGASAQLPRHAAWAWFAAWPLTQCALLVEPALRHYGGLSGVLHAGTCVVGLHLVLRARGMRRAIGLAIVLGVLLKVAAETPWGAPVRHWPGWDIAVAPLAHATGALAGLLCALLADTIVRWRMDAA